MQHLGVGALLALTAMRVEGSLSVCLSAVYLIICEHICAFVMKDKIFDGIKPIF